MYALSLELISHLSAMGFERNGIEEGFEENERHWQNALAF